MGHAINKPVRLIEEMDTIASDYHIQLTHAEEHYYAAMHEIGAYAGEFACLGGDFSFVGAGLGGGFANTAELHVMKYDEAMATDEKEQWEKAVEEEHG